MNIMVWYDLGSYAFNAAWKTITFSWLGNVMIEQVRLITNVTDWVIIYNFASAAKKGVMSNNVLTLDYDTTTMSDTDSLQIDLAYNNNQDYNLWVTKNIPQSFAPVQTSDSEVLVSTSTVIWSAVAVWATQWVEIDIRDVAKISFLITHTHSTSTAVKFRLQFSDAIWWIYYTPITSSYTVAVWDTTGTKSLEFDVSPYLYCRLQWYVETATTDTATIKLSKTLHS